MRANLFNKDVKRLFEQQDRKLKAVVFVGSLKPKKEQSGTYALALDVAEQLKKNGVSQVKIIYLYDFRLEPGITRKVNVVDSGVELYSLIEESDIVIFGTPIWWGAPSSFIQRVIERMDEFDEYYLKGDKNHLYGKVFGMIVTGTEDGVQACTARMAGWATHLGFTIPPEALAYWLREEPYKQGSTDKAVIDSISKTAKNLVDWTRRLKTQQKEDE